MATTCAGLFAIARTVDTSSTSHCARSVADAVALAHVAHGSSVAAEFARMLGARVEVLGDSPLTVRVASPCGIAVSAADLERP